MTATVPHISSVSGIQIKRWDYTEPQSGKGPCDRAAAWIKRKVWNRVAENFPARTPEEFVDAASSYGGTEGVSIVLGNVQPPRTVPRQKPFMIPAISKFFNFEFYDSYVVAWKAYGIGSGHRIPLSNMEGIHLQSMFPRTIIKKHYQNQIS